MTELATTATPGTATPSAERARSARPPDAAASSSHQLARLATLLVGAGTGWLVATDGSPAGRTIARLTRTPEPRPGRRAVLALVVGLVALAGGVGIAVPHVTKVGWSGPTTAGTLCVVGGVGLVGVGVRAAWRRFPGAGRVGLVPALLAALFVAVWVVGQAVAVTNVPRTEVGAETPADRGLPYTDVVFRTEDDVVLSGWYVPSVNGAAVVLLHGAGSTRSSVLDHAVVLARHGYGVLAFDARGHGASGGRAMDFGWFGDTDIAAAVTFLHGRADVDPTRIGAVGLSMGGEEAIGAAAADADLRAVVAEGATTRTAADKAWLSDEFGIRGTIQEGVDWLMYRTTDLLTDAHPPVALRDAVALAAPRPVLLIAGGDVPDEAPAGRYIRSGAPDSVTLWVVPGTGHTDALRTHPDEWEARVVEFLDAALTPTA